MARLRTVMSVDFPQGRDLNITRVRGRWGQASIPKVGQVRFRWAKDLPVGKRADVENRIDGATRRAACPWPCCRVRAPCS
ncbi:hypothetical protein EES39_06950 [Streptomyces sp. ADI92-24]|nr:hypothetical protein EES39_06950 [Streptomyces sp. ADI92-24]